MMALNLEDAEEASSDTADHDDRKARLARYAARDKLVHEILAAYFARRLRVDPSFRADYERMLVETDPWRVCRLIFSDQEEQSCRGYVMARQKNLRLPQNEALTLEEALSQILPLLRRGKLSAVAEAHASAILRDEA